VNPPNQPPELRSAELLDALQRHRVQFVVVGGFAAQLHGATRQTKDLDLCPARSKDNLDRLAAALHDLAARLRLPPELGDVEVRANAKLLREITVTHWRTRAGDIDVLHAISGREGKPVGYRELRPRSITVQIDTAIILVAALEDIITAKEHANRIKDRQALPELRALQARTTSNRLPPPAHDPTVAASPSATPRPPDRSTLSRPPPTLGH